LKCIAAIDHPLKCRFLLILNHRRCRSAGNQEMLTLIDDRFYTREQTAAEVPGTTACAGDRHVEWHTMRGTPSIDDA
jgi:hypothetical protein